MRITSIKPRVSRDEAVKKFRGPLREMRRGRLEMVVDFYIPYRLFEVSISNANKTIESLLAIDSVTGQLDLYSFDDLPADEEEMKIETDRVAKTALGEAEAFSILKEKVRRSVYLKGFFKVRNFQLRASCVARLHIPYWVGIYKRGDVAGLDVLDALRCSFEGSKVREMITSWFKQPGCAMPPQSE